MFEWWVQRRIWIYLRLRTFGVFRQMTRKICELNFTSNSNFFLVVNPIHFHSYYSFCRVRVSFVCDRISPLTGLHFENGFPQLCDRIFICDWISLMAVWVAYEVVERLQSITIHTSASISWQRRNQAFLPRNVPVMKFWIPCYKNEKTVKLQDEEWWWYRLYLNFRICTGFGDISLKSSGSATLSMSSSWWKQKAT